MHIDNINISKTGKVEGMRLGSTFLTNEKSTVEAQLEERIYNTFTSGQMFYISRLKSALTRAINVLGGQTKARQCYQAYETFERALTKFLGEVSQPVPISAITVVQDGKGKINNIVYNSHLKNSVSKAGASTIYSGLKNDGQLENGYRLLQLSELLQEHYQKFYSKAAALKEMQNYEAGPKAGFIAETYIAHVTKQHQNLLKSSIEPEKIPANLSCNLKTLKDEILETISHHDDWYRGGDLILMDEHKNIVLNLQIKSTTTGAERVGKLSRTNLLKRLTRIKHELLKLESDISRSEVKTLAKEIYNMFKTSAIEADSLIDFTIDDLTNF